MSAYLFQIELPDFTEEMNNILPQHRAYVNQLFSEGRLLAYSVSASRDTLWCVINAEDEQEAMDIIGNLPLHQHFHDVSCHPLLFHNVLPASLPNISLN